MPDDQPLGVLQTPGICATALAATDGRSLLDSILDGCGCDEGQDEHPCPYDEDVNNDPDSACSCCESCTQECGDSI